MEWISVVSLVFLAILVWKIENVIDELKEANKHLKRWR